MTDSSPDTLSFLIGVAEPTRLRIINCLAAAPLFVSDIQTVLDLPQPTVSRHLQVLRRLEVVRDTPVAQFVLYRLARRAGPPRLLRAILESMATDPELAEERERAAARSREHVDARLAGGRPVETVGSEA